MLIIFKKNQCTWTASFKISSERVTYCWVHMTRNKSSTAALFHVACRNFTFRAVYLWREPRNMLLGATVVLKDYPLWCVYCPLYDNASWFTTMYNVEILPIYLSMSMVTFDKCIGTVCMLLWRNQWLPLTSSLQHYDKTQCLFNF